MRATARANSPKINSSLVAENYATEALGSNTQKLSHADADENKNANREAREIETEQMFWKRSGRLLLNGNYKRG
jgi:hypothetical protein